MACTTSGRQLGRTPLGVAIRGLIAGAVGIAAMDALWFARYRRAGGKSNFMDWEFSSGLCTWDQAPAPALMGKRMVEGVFDREVPAHRAALVNNLTHWAYGVLAGIPYGIVAGSLRTPRIRYGLPFGVAVWATSYVVLPIAKLYKPIWEYDRDTLYKDFSAHAVYGLGTSTAFYLSDFCTRRNA